MWEIDSFSASIRIPRSLSDETPALQEGDQVINFFFNPFPRIRLIDQGSRLTV
jgi:hypothetical protein